MSNLLNTAWSNLFDKYDILSNIEEFGFFEISADNIKEFREPRLMTKFDYKSNLPALFKTNNLSILPNSRSSYIIGNYNAYTNFNDDSSIENNIPILFEHNYETLDFKNLNSESNVINSAHITKILENFFEEEVFQTINGRMGSGVFDFNINSYSNNQDLNIKVNKAQLEIDGGFEGENNFYLIEAKNIISDDFLIRQLYYPYRLWKNKIQKNIKPIFLTYSNGIYTLREYRFNELTNYSSIELIKSVKYHIQDSLLTLDVIIDISNKVTYIQEPKIPFPQADKFERVINLCEILKSQEFLTKEEVTSFYQFDERQSDYYLNAGRYLSLINKTNRLYSLSEEGNRIFNLSLYERKKELINKILEHKPFNIIFEYYISHSQKPNKHIRIELLKDCNLYKVDSLETLGRRSSTIIRWIDWILTQNEDS